MCYTGTGMVLFHKGITLCNFLGALPANIWRFYPFLTLSVQFFFDTQGIGGGVKGKRIYVSSFSSSDAVILQT